MQRLVDWKRSLRDSIGQRRPLDELHHQGLHSVSRFKAVDDRDVGMVQRGKDLCLSLEPSETLGISRERVSERLQGIVPFERAVVRSPDLAHATSSEEGSHLIGTDTSARPDRHLGGFYAIRND